MSFTILTVCSGNICRSPLAEQLLRAGLSHIDGVSIASAGTTALVGEGMPEPAAALSARFRGAGAAAHRARQIEERFIREADLVLGLSREHRRAIVELVPAATRYTFTLREFAQLGGAVTDMDLDDAPRPLDRTGEGRLRAAVSAAASLRGLVPPFESPDDADVIDPYCRPDSVYDASADQIVPAVHAIIALFERAAQRT